MYHIECFWKVMRNLSCRLVQNSESVISPFGICALCTTFSRVSNVCFAVPILWKIMSSVAQRKSFVTSVKSCRMLIKMWNVIYNPNFKSKSIHKLHLFIWKTGSLDHATFLVLAFQSSIASSTMWEVLKMWCFKQRQCSGTTHWLTF